MCVDILGLLSSIWRGDDNALRINTITILPIHSIYARLEPILGLHRGQVLAHAQRKTNSINNGNGRVPNSPQLCVFGVWEETGGPSGGETHADTKATCKHSLL